MSIKTILNISVFYLGEIMGFLIMLRVLLSVFAMMGKTNAFLRFVYQVTDPILLPIRSALNRLFKGPVMFDFSPIVAWLLIDYALVPLLRGLINLIFV